MEKAIDTFLFLPPPFNMIVLLVAIPILGTAVVGVATQIRRFAQHRADHQMKLEMIQNGVSIDEAERWVALKTSDLPDQQA